MVKPSRVGERAIERHHLIYRKVGRAHRLPLINPYLELLGYDVRDPMVCRLEYRADIGQGREKVDYAIMRDGRPLILIEAKAATENFSTAREAPTQLQRYFMAENVEFAALTNGVVWQWYRGTQEGKLRETPFLVHDVRSPEAAELKWLHSVSGPTFDAKKARGHAEEASIASAILAWLEEIRLRPSDDLVRTIMKEKNLGYAFAPKVERVRQSFVATFEAYVDRETDRVLDAARDQQREDARPASGQELSSPDDRDENREPRIVDLGDGGEPLNSYTRERAWRVKDGDWHREPNGRSLLVSVLRYLASIDGRGRHRFYDETVTAMGERMFSDTQEHPHRWRRVEPGIEKFVKIHRSYHDMEQLLTQACSQCRPASGAPVRFGEDVEVLLNL